jgi:hypothetical protein
MAFADAGGTACHNRRFIPEKLQIYKRCNCEIPVEPEKI